MKRISLFAALSMILGLCCLPASAFASCAGPFTLQEHLHMADAVVAGTAKGNFFGNYVKFNVDRYYKGSGPAIIAVRGSESKTGITSVDYEIKTGQSYLLFLKKVDDLSYKTNSCAGNEIIGQASPSPLTTEQAAVLGSGITPDQSANAFIYKDQLGWLMAIVGYGYVLPILLALSIIYPAYIVLYNITRRIRVRNYQIVLLVLSGAYIIFYLYIQRLI